MRNEFQTFFLQTGYLHFVFEQETEENIRLVIYKSSLTKGIKLCY